MKKNILLSYVLSLILICLCQTIIAQSPNYFSSGDFNPPASYNQAFAYGMGTIAGTNIQGSYPTLSGTNSSYFRFFSANSGGTIYEPSGNASLPVPLDSPFALQVGTGLSYAYYVPTYNTTDKYIFKTSGVGSPGTARCAVIRLIGPVVGYITGITQVPAGNIYAGESVTVTATLDSFNEGEGVYLRYSTDGYLTSTVIPMTMAGADTQYTATIPDSANVSGATLSYYLFTSGDSLTIAGADADLMTINLYNNNSSNFSYYVDCPFELSNSSFQMLQTDKARYNPSDAVNLTATFQSATSGTLVVKYWHLGDSIGQSTYTISNATSYSWTWQAPATDYSGYFVQATLQQSGVNVDSASIAIDVSSQYNRFPRYGFLSQYSPADATYTDDLFQRLNRYHLNGLQFYDVNNKHDVPLAGTVGSPDSVWNDIANRENYLSTVLSDISAAHSYNMKAMDYNLLYGAWTATAVADGVSPTWGLYYDVNHTTPWEYTLPATWASNLQVEDPTNTNWQTFLWGNESNLFQAIPYDGWHIDQLGDPGTIYNYNGTQVNLSTAFGPYIQAAKTSLNVNMVMNAVTNFGQQSIATAPVDFLYTEVWDPYDSYNAFPQLIDSNNTYSNNALASVFAAYINQPLSGSAGFFNTPGVLLADAAIFASGGAHIELGDHMLGNSYFPNTNLKMSCGLEQNMIQYYDFFTAYENLLRDSITASTATLQTSGGTALATTATLGSVWVQSTQRTNTQIFQLINLVSANTLNWRDSFGTQPAPTVLTNIPVSFTTGRQISKVFVASPDWNNGLPQQVSYTLSSGTLSVTIPYLNYWTMLVVDYTPILTTSSITGSPFCSGSTVSVPFTVSSSFETGNIFTAQLSDSTGSFASPINIGSMTGTGSGTMTDTIPANALHGTGYRIRVVASAPYTIGSDNGADLTIIPSVTPTISVSANAGTTICAGTPAGFTATATNAGSLPTYQWKVNNTNAGTNASTFSSSTLTDSAIVYCILTSNAVCANPTTVISDSIIEIVNPVLVPTDSISANPSGAVCINSNVVFTAHPGNGGATPSYVWRVNGTIVGTNSPTYNSSTLHNGDVVSNVMTSSYACASPDSASFHLTMNISSTVTPTISITASPSGSVCAGTDVVFHSTISGGGSSPTFEWYVNGVSNAVTTDSFSSTSLGNGNIVTCVLTSSSTCASVSTATSNPDTAHVNANVVPTISITPTHAAICAGKIDSFTASITNGGASPLYDWKKNGTTVGTSAIISLDSLLSTDVISCTLTSDAACASPLTANSNNVSITIDPLPSATITSASSTTICQGDSVELSAPAGNTSYVWNNGNGTTQNIFAKLAGAYSVTVTNVNGCSAVSSPVTVSVNPLPAAPTITSSSNDSLFSTPGVSYQWYLNNSAIAHATNPNLVMTQDGNYQVQITDANGCSNISTAYDEVNLGLTNVLSSLGVKLYPNPNSGSFVLEFSDKGQHEISISDEVGKVIVSNTVVTGSASFDLGNISSGIYFMNVHEDGQMRSIKFTIVK